MPVFSHLHCHTQYSLLDGAASIDSLYKKAAKDGMPAIAITDHGNMFGAFQFVSEAWKNTRETGKDTNGKPILEPVIKPIVGCEFYVVEDRFRKVFTKEQKDVRYHQVLLAKNKQGYQNLIKLTSLGFIEGMYSKYPRIDKALLAQYHEGLIATTCCIGAYVPQTILRQDEAAAEKEFQWWHQLFGDDYFVELQRHDMEEQQTVNEVLLRFAKKYQVPVIATNDSHYTDRDDYNAHDILLCINTGEKQSTPGFDDITNDEVHIKNRRFKFPNDQFYFKTTAEMSSLFADIPEAIDNTNIIVDRVEVLNLQKDVLLPNFPIPPSFAIHADDVLNQWEYLRHLTYEGARKRYGDITPDVQERIDFELNIINIMGFAGYFLIVSDFIQAGRDIGVFVGPGRGSAAGSAVAYCIGITNIDPIKYNLLFERFLNPDRKSMPDIDTDFDDEGRQKVIDYVVQKYGQNQVAQIVTFGTMAAKSSIKDVARVMDLSLPESNALAKLVPDKPGTQLRRVLHAPLTAKDGEKSLEEKDSLGGDDLENAKLLRQIYNGTDLRAAVLHEAERLEGSVRNTGLHAAGIIIAPQDLTQLIPVATAKDSSLWITQIEGSVIEQSGVIKMDFLGLKTLSILKTAIELIKENHGICIIPDDLPLDDAKTYQLYQRGETNGTFQFESTGMQKHLRNLKPDKFADLIAMNALYRPGPMAYIDKFIARKHGTEIIEYDLPEMEEYLAETYGITVYQEQVMLLAQKIGGFSKGDADVLRKAMGKKQKSVLDKMKAQFLEGATAKGHPEDKLEKIWTDWEAFAQYAFNKSHSTCYAFVAYQTAYLKAHYPSEYMAAVLNHAGTLEKITFFMEECRRMGIKVLGPDINESKKGFAVNKKAEIRFGLGGLKGVGENGIENIIEERTSKGPYKNIFDFIMRINQRMVNKRSLESLIYSGAFDCFEDLHRAQYFHTPKGDTMSGLDRIVKYGNQLQQQQESSSHTLFGNLSDSMDVQLPKLPACEQWTLTEKLGYEKEVTGMFISGHPLDHFPFELKYFGITRLSDFNEFCSTINDQMNPLQTFRLAGLVVSTGQGVTKNGKIFAKMTIEDYAGKVDLIFWSQDAAKFQTFLKPGLLLFMVGQHEPRMSRDSNQELVQTGWSFKIHHMQLLETVLQKNTKQVEIHMDASYIQSDMIGYLEKSLKKSVGITKLKFKITDSLRKYDVELVSAKGYTLNEETIAFLLKQTDLDIKVAQQELN